MGQKQELCGFNVTMCLIDSCVWILSPQQGALFWENVKLLGDGGFLEKVGHWG